MIEDRGEDCGVKKKGQSNKSDNIQDQPESDSEEKKSVEASGLPHTVVETSIETSELVGNTPLPVQNKAERGRKNKVVKMQSNFNVTKLTIETVAGGNVPPLKSSSKITNSTSLLFQDKSKRACKKKVMQSNSHDTEIKIDLSTSAGVIVPSPQSSSRVNKYTSLLVQEKSKCDLKKKAIKSNSDIAEFAVKASAGVNVPSPESPSKMINSTSLLVQVKPKRARKKNTMNSSSEVSELTMKTSAGVIVPSPKTSSNKTNSTSLLVQEKPKRARKKKAVKSDSDVLELTMKSSTGVNIPEPEISSKITATSLLLQAKSKRGRKKKENETALIDNLPIEIVFEAFTDQLIESPEHVQNTLSDDQDQSRDNLDLDENFNKIDRTLSVDSNDGEQNECLLSSLVLQYGLQGNSEIVEFGPMPYPGRPKRGRKLKVVGQSRSDKKKLLNRNKIYINSEGDFVEPRSFDNNFECKCSRKCTDIVPMDLRKRLFDQFWDIGTHEGRCALLISCVSEMEKEKSSTKGPSKRCMTRKYVIFGHNVCKVAFLKTLQINQSRINTALNKCINANTFADRRGEKSGGKNALSLSKKLEVFTHIDSFPKYVSHYCREKTDAKFLGPELNLSLMYRLYKEDHEDPASFAYYKRVFYDSFNLRFKTPKKDTCLKCDFFQIQRKQLSGVQLQELQEFHEDHIKKSEDWQNQMKADMELSKSNAEVAVLNLDMQKTQSMPKLSINIVYYKRQLNLYNLGLHEARTGKGIFNLWLEHEGGKGTQEMGSCLRKYIFEDIKAPVKTLILWCDSCGGQNRSIKLMLALIHILQNHTSLETITVKYLMSGHSILPNDSEFGDVERELKKHSAIYTDVDYIEKISFSRIENKFVVNRLSSKDFYSVGLLSKAITNRKIDVNKTKVSWLRTHQITMEKANPTILKMTDETINSTPQVVDIGKRGHQVDLKSIVLEPLWPAGKVLSENKISDLKELRTLVPDEFKSFYNFLNTVESENFEDDVDGYGPYDFEDS